MTYKLYIFEELFGENEPCIWAAGLSYQEACHISKISLDDGYFVTMKKED